MASSIDTITTRFEADLLKFEASMKKMVSTGTDSTNKVVQKHKEAHDKIDSIWGKTNGIEAFNKVLANTRLTVFEEGATRIPIFGSALEALGPAGLAAAAGLAAVFGAMEMAKGAAEYAETISNTAAKLGITTKALQEYNYVAIGSGISTDAMTEALQKGNEALGAFQSGVGAAKLKPVFQALGISQEEASKASNITQLLPEIAEKIKGLASTAEQSKIAEKLGLESILPVLQKGREGIEELTAEAERSGAVLDTSMIAKGKEAAEELKKTSDVVDIQMKRAFINLAPAIAACLGLAAQLAKSFADTVENFGPISNYSKNHAQDAADTSKRTMDYWAQNSGGLMTPQGKVVDGQLVGGTAFARYKYNNSKQDYDQSTARVNQLNAEDAKAEAATHHGPAKQLVPDKPGKKGPKPDGDEVAKTVNDTLDTAQKALDSALANLTKNIEIHASYEKKAVDDALAKQTSDLAAEKKKIDNDATIDKTQKAILKGKLDQALLVDQQTATAKKQAIDDKAEDEKTQKWLQEQDAINAIYSSIANMKAGMALTAAGKNKINSDNLAFNQKNERNDFEIKSAQSIQDGTSTSAQVSTQRNALLDKQSTERDQQAFSQRNPVQQYTDGLKDVNNQLDQIKVKGLEGVTDAITDAILHTKSLGAAFHDVAMSVVSDLLKIGVQQLIVAPLAGMLFGNNGQQISSTSTASGGLFGGIFHSLGIPGFAQETNSAPGGLAWVGEQGPEVVNLPKGSQVIPNHNLGKVLNTGTGSQVQQQNYNLTTVVNANDSVMTSTVQTWIAMAHQSAIQTAVSQASTQSATARRNSLIR